MNQTRMRTRWLLGVLVAVLGLFALPQIAAAQVDVLGMPVAAPTTPLDPEPQTWGTAAQVSHTISAFAFQAFGATQPSSGVGGSRFCTATCELVSGIFLPAGAQALSVQLDGCDTDAVANITVVLLRRGISESAFQALTLGSTSGAPGCTPLNVPLVTPHTIDNANNLYFLDIQMSGPTNATRFTSARVFYRLQVSPAPATATFPNDVPTTHPFFRFIEALAAAGITGGCGPGSYCPDSPVTRGQMAVFLATTLGLHFPN
jgi:S-layer family protein